MKNQKQKGEEIEDIDRAHSIMSKIDTEKPHHEDDSYSSVILREQQYDKTCPECGLEMKKVNIKKGKQYSSPIDIYRCECGFERRKRTLREILRDLGDIE